MQAYLMFFNLVDFLFILVHLHLVLHEARHFCCRHSLENMTNICLYSLFDSNNMRLEKKISLINL